jgi:hypothetical protein
MIPSTARKREEVREGGKGRERKEKKQRKEYHDSIEKKHLRIIPRPSETRGF